jgi:hypothetical protein
MQGKKSQRKVSALAGCRKIGMHKATVDLIERLGGHCLYPWAPI